MTATVEREALLPSPCVGTCELDVVTGWCVGCGRTGDEIAGLSEPFELPAGVHVLTARHPDYGSERLVFGVPAAGEILVEINLMGDRSGRKARLRTAWEIEARLRQLRP